MQSFNWAPEHSGALRDCLSRGMSYGQAADAINARFGTQFTRNAAVGRAKRLGLKVAPGRKVAPRPQRPEAPPIDEPKARLPDTPAVPAPVAARPEPVKLRCVGIKPRLLAFTDLEPDDCRYPYGGEKDGEAMAFCGHPKLAGSSYCAPHHHLTRGLGTASERAAGAVLLRLVRAA
jgi:GcrA cell cycle regulator